MDGLDLTPLSALQLLTPRLGLRLPSLVELDALAALAEQGIHPASEMPFLSPWSARSGEPGFRDGFVSHHLLGRTNWTPDNWKLPFAVWAAGELIGVQSLNAAAFARDRTVSTGSWLGQRFQGQGYGTEMRAAVLHFAFVSLGARAADSGSLDWNAASLRVSEKLGYQRNGEILREAADGAVGRELRLRLDPVSWQRAATVTVDVVGFSPQVAALCGAACPSA